MSAKSRRQRVAARQQRRSWLALCRVRLAKHGPPLIGEAALMDLRRQVEAKFREAYADRLVQA